MFYTSKSIYEELGKVLTSSGTMEHNTHLYQDIITIIEKEYSKSGEKVAMEKKGKSSKKEKKKGKIVK